ncbi:MAG: class I SAM-dependent methyltransferase [Candidatus Omnitrophota bacterium]
MDKSSYKRTEVYLSGRRIGPKHIFVVIGDKISQIVKDGVSLLDVGGAAGELGGYMLQRFPCLKVSVLEYDKELFKAGKETNKGITFVNGDANKMNAFAEDAFNIVTMVGVMNIFDDFTLSLNECIRVCKKDGQVIVVSPFNEFPVDILVRWKYSGKGDYNPGYNTFSKKTISDFLSMHPKVQSFAFEKFVLPFDLQKQEDPIRTWTEIGKDGGRVFKNAIGEINLQILSIELKKNIR